MSEEILVTGVSGFIGRPLASKLLKRGERVVGMVRGNDAEPHLESSGLEVRRADALSGEGLEEALRGVQTAYYLIHSMGGKGRDFAERDARAARNFLAAAESQGVERIVYLGGLGEPDLKLSPHLASRHEVGLILQSGSVPTTILRAAVIVGPGGASTDMVYYLTRRLPVMVTPRWVRQRIQPVYIGDVLEYLVGCLDHPETSGQVFDLGGPEVLTYREMMIQFAQVMGRRRVILDVPVLTPKLSAYWVDLVTPVDRGVAFALIEGLRNEVVVRDDRIRHFVPIEPTPFRVAAACTLDGIAGFKAARRPGWEIPDDYVALLEEGASDWYALLTPRAASGGEAEGRNGEGYVEVRATRVRAPINVVFEAICSIGGRNGWYSANWAWRLRGFLDRLVGGPGMRRGVARSPIPAVGDELDFWRVKAIENPGDLVLEAEMRVPGEAYLGFHLRPGLNSDCLLFERVEFQPSNWLGRVYWWAMYPIHQFIFRRMLRNFAASLEDG